MMTKDNEFNDLIWKGIELSSNFREDFVDEHKLENFMALLDAVLNLLADSEAEFSNGLGIFIYIKYASCYCI